MADSQHTLDKIWSLAEQAASRQGCFVYDIELVGQGGGRTLRIYLDKNVEGGVSLDDCTEVSHGLNLLLDVEDVVPGGAYNLEVSSPGLERKLKRVAHFRSVLGKKIFVRMVRPFGEYNEGLAEALGKRRQAEAIVQNAEDDFFEVELGELNIKLPYEGIEKSYLVFVDPNESVKRPLGPKKDKKPKAKKR